MRRHLTEGWDDGLWSPLLIGFGLSLCVAFLAGILLWKGWYDHQDTQFGRHGVLTVRDCDERTGESGRLWDCVGPFSSDDGGLRLDRVKVTLTERPGEVVHGWVRDGADKDLNPVADPVDRARFDTWVRWAVVAAGAPLAIGLLTGLGRVLAFRRGA